MKISLKNSSTKAQILGFDKFFYAQVSGDFSEDELFLNGLKTLNLQANFEFQMSFFKRNEKNHLFFARFNEINLKAKFALAEPLIFHSLQEFCALNFDENFAILIFTENYGVLYFYEQGKFCALKGLPKFSLNDLRNLDEKDEFFKQILFSAGRVLELLKYHKSTLLFTFNDEFNFQNFAQKYFKTKRLEELLGEKFFEDLINFSLKNINENENFIKKTSIKFKLILKIFGAFFVGFVLIFSFLLVKNYSNIKQNINERENLALFQKEEKAMQNTQNQLSKDLNDLKSNLQNLQILLIQNENVFQKIKQEFQPSKNQGEKLLQIFKFLNQSELILNALSLKNTHFKLFFNDAQGFKKAIEIFEKNVDFEIVFKDETKSELNLDLKND